MAYTSEVAIHIVGNREQYFPLLENYFFAIDNVDASIFSGLDLIDTLCINKSEYLVYAYRLIRNFSVYPMSKQYIEMSFINHYIKWEYLSHQWSILENLLSSMNFFWSFLRVGQEKGDVEKANNAKKVNKNLFPLVKDKYFFDGKSIQDDIYNNEEFRKAEEMLYDGIPISEVYESVFLNLNEILHAKQAIEAIWMMRKDIEFYKIYHMTGIEKEKIIEINNRFKEKDKG